LAIIARLSGCGRYSPRWEKLFAVSKAQLSPAEQAFLDGPVEELCRRLDDWDITHNRRDLPP
jgi:acyl-CoA dehydrogenase